MSGLCKFYLQGSCKFGSRCRFKHEEPYRNYSNHNNYYWASKDYSGNSYRGSDNSSNSTNYNSNNQRGTTNDMLDVLNAVQKEIETLQEGKQWPLTCFVPIKDLAGTPGWIDHSPEEVRWEMYKSVKDGNVEEYKLKIQQLYKEAQHRRLDFSYKEKGLALLESMKANKDGWLNVRSTSLENNVFQNQNSAATITGNSNIFLQNTVAGAGGNFFQQNPSVTGMDTVLNSSTQQSSPFNVAQQQVDSASLQQTGQLFHDPKPSFTFSLGQNSNNSNVNATVPVSAVPQTFQPATNLANNQFGFNNSGTVQTNPSIEQPFDDTIFSRGSDLTEEEMVLFKATTFKFGKVPLNPPPRELCDISKFI